MDPPLPRVQRATGGLIFASYQKVESQPAPSQLNLRQAFEPPGVFQKVFFLKGIWPRFSVDLTRRATESPGQWATAPPLPPPPTHPTEAPAKTPAMSGCVPVHIEFFKNLELSLRKRPKDAHTFN